MPSWMAPFRADDVVYVQGGGGVGRGKRCDQSYTVKILLKILPVILITNLYDGDWVTLEDSDVYYFLWGKIIHE